MNPIAHPQPPVRYSVVIPAYDAARWIGATLESWTAQTDSRFEVVVVDDGSTDETIAIVESFSARLAIRTMPGGRSGGPARPRNIGIRAARTDLIVMCDADDLAHPNRLQRTGEAWTLAGERPCMILSDFSEIDEYGRVITQSGISRFPFPRNVPQHALSSTIVRIEGRHVFDALLLGDFHRTCSLAISKQVIEAVGLYDETLANGQDYDAILRIAAAGFDLIYVAEPLGMYRLTTGNISSRSTIDTARGRIAVMKKTMPLTTNPRQRAQIEECLASIYRDVGYEWATRRRLLESLAAYWRATLHSPSLSTIKGILRAVVRRFVR